MTDNDAEGWRDGWLKGERMRFRYLKESLVPTTSNDPDASVIEVVFRDADDKRVLLVADKHTKVPPGEHEVIAP